MGHPNKVQPQRHTDTQRQHNVEIAPLWMSTLAALVFGITYAILPKHITLGPGWLPLAIELVLILPGTIATLLHHPFSARTNSIIAFLILGLITIFLIIGIILLIVTLPQRKENQAASLLHTGGLLWIANVLVFSLWYWEIDGNGPHKRAKTKHKARDLLFPQQIDGNTSGWIPYFIDYLFVSFTAATAFSPTDTEPLTHRVKALMIIEALIAMIVISILISRATNIL